MAREYAGLSQGQVARLLDMHRPTISEIEAGRRKVSAEELGAFAKTYDVSISWLTGEDSKTEDALGDRVELAARELAKLKKEDVEVVLKLLRSLRGMEGKEK
jgi:transcriptional regulator with XRE-family HTH domain